MEGMKLRIGMIVAFGTGYVLGTKAGYQRYQQIAQAAGRVRQSTPVAGATGLATDKAKAAATLGTEWVRGLVATRLGRHGDDEVELTVVSVSSLHEPTR